MAKSVLYKKGYKIGTKISHKVTADALVVYTKKELKKLFFEEYKEAKEDASELAELRSEGIIKSFNEERNKRSRFQYSMTETAMLSKAETSLKRAKRFIFEIEKVLQELIP